MNKVVLFVALLALVQVSHGLTGASKATKRNLLRKEHIHSRIAAAAGDKVVCYFGSWATEDGSMAIDTHVDPTLCTHLIYGFVLLAGDGTLQIRDPYIDLSENGGLGGYEKFVGLRNKNPNAKFLIALGGGSASPAIFSSVAANDQLRAALVSSAYNFLGQRGFDGLDFDWEFPGAGDKANFATLLAELRATFNAHDPPYLLTAAVSALYDVADAGYDVPALAQHLDFINVMAYDYHGAGWSQSTGVGQNAPLYAGSADVSDYQRTLNVDAGVSYFVSRGAPVDKLVVGTGLYGRTFTLVDPGNNGVGAPFSGPGEPGPVSHDAGSLRYSEICVKLQSGGWTVVWDSQQVVPYAFQGDQWIGYDNEQSIATKVDYAKNRGLAGVMVWSLEQDDFLGNCGQSYPLLRVINNALRG